MGWVLAMKLVQFRSHTFIFEGTEFMLAQTLTERVV